MFATAFHNNKILEFNEEELTCPQNKCRNSIELEFQDSVEEPPTLNLTNFLQNEFQVEQELEGRYKEDDAWKVESESVAEELEDSDDEEDSVSQSAEMRLTEALMAGYRSQRVLWNVPGGGGQDDPKLCEAAFKRITRMVNRKMGTKLEWHQVEELIKKLDLSYQQEVQNDESTITPKTRRKKETKKASTRKKSTLPLSNLNDFQLRNLIAFYKSYPCLWDVDHIGYRLNKQRENAMQEMLQTINATMNVEFSVGELQTQLYRLRYACSQEKLRKLKCERGRQEFKPICKYYEQMSFLYDNVAPFECDYCGKVTNGIDQHRIHRSTHDGSRPFTCSLCKRGFQNASNYTVHLRRHTRDYHFECEVCGKFYATSTDVNVHMRRHTGEKPYFCEICGHSARTWTFFNAHMRRHQKRPGYICTICSKGFYEKCKLRDHMNGHFDVRDQLCKTCGKAFTCSKYLRQHEQIHAEKKKYSCRICGKEFAQCAGLSGHMKRHGTTIDGTLSKTREPSE